MISLTGGKGRIKKLLPGTKIISDVVTLTVRDRVPTGDNSNLPLYMGVALFALALLIILRKKEKRA